MIVKTQLCQILTESLEISLGPSSRNASKTKCLISQRKRNAIAVTVVCPLLRG